MPRLARASSLIGAVGALTLAALACGSGSRDIGDYGSRSWKGVPSTEAPVDYARRDGALVVPPDRAVIRVDVRVTEASAEAAASAARAEIAALTSAAASETCAATPVDYGAPEAEGKAQWVTRAEVRVDIALVGRDSLDARMETLDGCLATLEPTLTRGSARELSEDGRSWVTRSAPWLEVDDVDQHLGALLAQASVRLNAVHAAVAAHPAPQLAPDDLRCTPTGRVTIVDRRLSGIELALDMACETVRPELDGGGGADEG